jgi:hypothetical protein
MSGLVDIEKAVSSLPTAQQEDLLRWLQSKLAAGEPKKTSGKAAEWVREAKGSVRLSPGESADDVRLDYYTTKYGLNR